jgi:hypothetical protein
MRCFKRFTATPRKEAKSAIRQTLRVTPAMEAGVSDHVWTIEEIVRLLELD